MNTLKDESGLTLIELMIALAISSILLIAMIAIFEGQTRSYNAQQTITSLQEDMWASLQLMTREIRMAAYNYTQISGGSQPQILLATSTRFRASQDTDENGTVDDGEILEYSYNAASNQIDRITYTTALVASAQPVMNNVMNMAFEYQVVTKNTGVPWTWIWTQSPTAVDLADIRAVKVCIQARTNRPSKIGKASISYTPPFSSASYNWTPPASDKYPRRILCTDVKLRNMLD